MIFKYAISDINECVDNTHDCSSNGICSNTPGGYECKCKPGFDGDGKSCKDINECETGESDCSFDAKCTNNKGSYSCECNKGYSGNGFTCDDIDECAANTASCPLNASCLNTLGRNFNINLRNRCFELIAILMNIGIKNTIINESRSYYFIA